MEKESWLFAFPGGLGDSIQALVALEAISQARQTVSIEACCRRDYLPLFKTCGARVKDWWATEDAANELAGRMFDYLIDCVALTHWRAELSSVGFRRIFTHSAFEDPRAMEGEVYVVTDGAASAGICFEPKTGPARRAYVLELQVAAAALDVPVEKLDPSDSLNPRLTLRNDVPWGASVREVCSSITLVPGGSLDEKRWPDGFYVELAHRLSKQGRRTSVLAGPCEQHVAALAWPKSTSVIRSADTLGMARCLQQSALVVANDCGPMHVAGALGRPLVAVFGPTNPKVWFTYDLAGQAYIQRPGYETFRATNRWDLMEWPSVDEVQDTINACLHARRT